MGKEKSGTVFRSDPDSDPYFFPEFKPFFFGSGSGFFSRGSDPVNLWIRNSAFSQTAWETEKSLQNLSKPVQCFSYLYQSYINMDKVPIGAKRK